MDLADPARALAGDRDPPAAARLQERLVARHDLDGDPELCREALQHTLDREEVRCDGLIAPASGLEGTGRERAHAPGLEGDRGPLADELAGEHAVLGE